MICWRRGGSWRHILCNGAYSHKNDVDPNAEQLERGRG
jgi:hypothetical protein